jgi:hypothetical protein
MLSAGLSVGRERDFRRRFDSSTERVRGDKDAKGSRSMATKLSVPMAPHWQQTVFWPVNTRITHRMRAREHASTRVHFAHRLT